jgi:hypothetical protein
MSQCESEDTDFSGSEDEVPLVIDETIENDGPFCNCDCIKGCLCYIAINLLCFFGF